MVLHCQMFFQIVCLSHGTKVVYAGFVGEWYIMFCDLRGSWAEARGPFVLMLKFVGSHHCAKAALGWGTRC
jgi:hypothetical protein